MILKIMDKKLSLNMKIKNLFIKLMLKRLMKLDGKIIDLLY